MKPLCWNFLFVLFINVVVLNTIGFDSGDMAGKVAMYGLLTVWSVIFAGLAVIIDIDAKTFNTQKEPKTILGVPPFTFALLAELGFFVCVGVFEVIAGTHEWKRVIEYQLAVINVITLAANYLIIVLYWQLHSKKLLPAVC